VTVLAPAPAARPSGAGLIDRIVAGEVGSFALLHRPEAGAGGLVDVLAGEMSEPASLGAIPLEPGPAAGPAHETLVVIPYRQLAERGYAAPDDGAPLLAMRITGQAQAMVPDLMGRIGDAPLTLSPPSFDIPDDAYADLVRRVINDEIGTGAGANFVIKRTVQAEIADYSVHSALAIFARLLRYEQGAYWTFLVHTGQRTFVGASPERHVSLSGGQAVMNPISGTYRYPAGGATFAGITEFLNDRKETDELYMVLDEELKMMGRICETGGRVTGPRLKEMARLAHTEYFIGGRTGRDVREILRETLFAPTVTGSPVENAARVIERYEPGGRGYYSGVVALIGRDAQGERALDSAILIRTADIDSAGQLRLGVGATVVRGSVPAAEAEETRAKAAGVLGAIEAGAGGRFGSHPEVVAALSRRNAGIAQFWLGTGGDGPAGPLDGLKALVVDAEDTFTAMSGHQLTALGLAVTIRGYDEIHRFADHDLVVLGPGPGDPRLTGDPKIAALRRSVDELLALRKPFLAVCLSHQVLCSRLGLELACHRVPHQGLQREIDLFGVTERVGFYNTFFARSPRDHHDAGPLGTVRVSRDPATGEVHALAGPGFASMQFHAESVLTVGGPGILARAIQGALAQEARAQEALAQ